jgi:hypothetical protein
MNSNLPNLRQEGGRLLPTSGKLAWRRPGLLKSMKPSRQTRPANWLKVRRFLIGTERISLGSAERAATIGRPRRVNAAGVPTPGLLRIGDWCSMTIRPLASRQLETGGCQLTMFGSWLRMCRLMGERPRCLID